MKRLWTCAAMLALTGCAGTVKYQPPMTSPTIQSSKDIARPRDDVWASLVPALGKQFFVINNLDKSSGLVNVSYSGDPEKYVNCGWITTMVKNARGERSYSFPGSRAQQQYEVFTPQMQLVAVDRSMSLDGRVNIVLEVTGPAATRASVNSRYVVKRDQALRDMEGRRANFSHSASFNGGAIGTFPGTTDGQALSCVSTGALEKEILDLVR